MKVIIDFLNNVEVNDPVNLTIMLLDIVCVLYIILYYLSKESKDERGHTIFGKSAFRAVIIYIIHFLFISHFAHDVILDTAFLQFIVNSSQLALVLPLAMSIIVLKRDM